MNILITGGAGFIGSHLCDFLIKNHSIICVDNLFTGSKENVSHLEDNGNFTFLSHDIVEPLLINKPIHQIYHLACPASPVHYQFDAIKTIKTNVMGTINVLELAKQHNARILLSSTSELYGDPLEHPQKETYWGNVNPIGIRSCYDEGKRCAETLMFDYHRQNGVDIKVVRIFNTYGPRMARHDGRVVSNFILQALGGKPITLYGDGGQTRSFCYITDLIRGIVMMMGKENFTGPVNLGNPAELTIAELAQTIISLSGSKSVLVNKQLPQDDPRQRMPDISLATKQLAWEPGVSLKEGLKKTIDWFKESLGATVCH